MTTLQDQYKAYVKAAYAGAKLPADQAREIHQAYFAGALNCILAFEEAAQTMTEDEAFAAMEKLRAEVIETLQHRVNTLKARN